MPLNKISLIENGMQIFNPSEEMLIKHGWKEYIHEILEPSTEELLKLAKDSKCLQLEEYDSSENVNICYIIIGDNQIPYWANKQERSILKTAIQNYIAFGKTVYRLDLRDKGVSININCNDLLQILVALEVYAIDCYNKTTDHQYAIQALTTIEEVEAYDYTVGYPEKLTFVI